MENTSPGLIDTYKDRECSRPTAEPPTERETTSRLVGHEIAATALAGRIVGQLNMGAVSRRF